MATITKCGAGRLTVLVVRNCWALCGAVLSQQSAAWFRGMQSCCSVMQQAMSALVWTGAVMQFANGEPARIAAKLKATNRSKRQTLIVSILRSSAIDCQTSRAAGQSANCRQSGTNNGNNRPPYNHRV